MNSNVYCITKIKTLFPGLTELEKVVADYVLRNPDEIHKLNIKEFAEKVSISAPTIYRFTRTLGYEGYNDFKMDLIKDLTLRMNISLENFSDESIESITRNVFGKDIENLKETLLSIDYDSIKKAVEIILNSKRIVFFAVGASLPIVFDSYLKFTRAGFNCFYNTDFYVQKIISIQCKKEDVAIGVSFSGESKEVVDCMKNAKSNGSKTISITTFIKSKITEYSDVNFFTIPVKSTYQKIDLPSKISQIALLDSLYLNVVLQNKKNSIKYITKAEEEYKF